MLFTNINKLTKSVNYPLEEVIKRLEPFKNINLNLQKNITKINNESLIKNYILELKNLMKDLKKSEFSWISYHDAFHAIPHIRFIFNDFFILFCIILFQIFFIVYGVYSIHNSFPQKQKLLFFIIIFSMIPIELLMIPNFIGFKKFGLIDSYIALITPILLSGFMTLIYLLFYKQMKKNEKLINFKSMWKNLKIVIIINAFVVLYVVINSFMWPLIIINSMKMKTISVGIACLQGLYSTSYPLMSAGIIINLIPILIVYSILSIIFIKTLKSYNFKN